MTLRAILLGLIALSLTVLPVSAVEMRASMAAGMPDMAAGMADMGAGTSDMAGHDECCPQSGDCEKQSKKDCGHSSDCLLKCSILSATTVAANEIGSPALASPNLPTLVERLHAALEHPPLPPPRT